MGMKPREKAVGAAPSLLRPPAVLLLALILLVVLALPRCHAREFRVQWQWFPPSLHELGSHPATGTVAGVALAAVYGPRTVLFHGVVRHAAIPSLRCGVAYVDPDAASGPGSSPSSSTGARSPSKPVRVVHGRVHGFQHLGKEIDPIVLKRAFGEKHPELRRRAYGTETQTATDAQWLCTLPEGGRDGDFALSEGMVAFLSGPLPGTEADAAAAAANASTPTVHATSGSEAPVVTDRWYESSSDERGRTWSIQTRLEEFGAIYGGPRVQPPRSDTRPRVTITLTMLFGYSPLHAHAVHDFVAWHRLLGADRIVLAESLSDKSLGPGADQDRLQDLREQRRRLAGIAAHLGDEFVIVRDLCSYETALRSCLQSMCQLLTANLLAAHTRVDETYDAPRTFAPVRRSYILGIDQDEFVMPAPHLLREAGVRPGDVIPRLALVLDEGRQVTDWLKGGRPGAVRRRRRLDPEAGVLGNGRCMEIRTEYFYEPLCEVSNGTAWTLAAGYPDGGYVPALLRRPFRGTTAALGPPDSWPTRSHEGAFHTTKWLNTATVAGAEGGEAGRAAPVVQMVHHCCRTSKCDHFELTHPETIVVRHLRSDHNLACSPVDFTRTTRFNGFKRLGFLATFKHPEQLAQQASAADDSRGGRGGWRGDGPPPAGVHLLVDEPVPLDWIAEYLRLWRAIWAGANRTAAERPAQSQGEGEPGADVSGRAPGHTLDRNRRRRGSNLSLINDMGRFLDHATHGDINW